MSTATAPNSTTTWNIDPAHSVAEFKVKHMMISNVKGQFTEGLRDVDPGRNRPEPSLSVEATIEAASIETRDAQRDAHLKSADFFDVEKFPTLAFKSTEVKPTAMANWRSKGDLTIRGRHPQGVFHVEGPTRRQGSLGQYPRRAVGHHQDQPQGLRPDLERGAGNRRNPGRRRSHYHSRCAVRESLILLYRQATSQAACAGDRKGRLCHSVQ